MIRENQKLINRINMILDALSAAGSLLLAYWLRFHVLNGHPTIPFDYYVFTALIIAPLYVVAFAFCNLYESQRRTMLGKALFKILAVELIFGLGLFASVSVLKLVDISRLALGFHIVFCTCFHMLKRVVVGALLRRYREKGFNQKHVLLIGSGPLADDYEEALRENPELGMRLIGYVGDRREERNWLWLGNYDQLDEILSNCYCDEAVAALEAEEFRRMGPIMDACEKAGTKLTLVPFYAKYTTIHPEVDIIGDVPLINIRRVPLDNLGNAFLKRAMDIAGSLLLLIVTSPVMLFAAVGTRLSSPGPVIFRQERVGKNKRHFTMYKFRSMRVNTDQETGWTTDSDNRKTRFGALLRKTSIDELPQFFNVLKGDMSLIGPRPEVPFFVEQFKEEIPLYMVKHQVRPGITGWAQVNGLRGDTSIKERIEHDIFYIENWNLGFDIKILFMTVFGGMVNSEKLNA